MKKLSLKAEATYIRVKDNEAWMQIKPFAPSKPEPVFKDGFLFDSDNLFEFKRDKKRKIIGLEVSTGRAENVLFTKIKL